MIAGSMVRALQGNQQTPNYACWTFYTNICLCTLFYSTQNILDRKWKRTELFISFLWSLRKVCGGGVEYLHRNPASGRRRQKRKSRIWDSKIWSRVPRESDPRMRWRKPAAIVNDRPILSSERMLCKDYDRRCSIEKKKIWPWVSRGSTPRRTDWRYTASCKVILSDFFSSSTVELRGQFNIIERSV
jgi:hypothetical protein